MFNVNFKRVLGIVAVMVLQACTTMRKVEVGEQAAGDDFKFTSNAGWNKLSVSFGPAQQWTREGLSLDQLLIYSGTPNGEPVHPVQPGSKLKPVLFNANMQPDQLVDMFKSIYARDGSDVKLTKTDTADWVGRKAVKFEFSKTRKVDNVKLLGVGYAVVEGGKLYSMVYAAPRLAFFPRELQGVEQMITSAKLLK
jgi:hypothetical protein